MNQSQIKHALGRAEAIYKRRQVSLKEKHTIPAVVLTPEEKRKALGAREFKVLDKVGIRWTDTLSNFVTFTAERDEVFDREAHDADLKVLKTDYDTLVDELVLGDNAEALKLLRAFEE